MKKKLLLCYCLLFCLTFLLKGQTIWDGTSDLTWYDATQTSFTISTAEQLAGFASIVNAGIDNFQGDVVTLDADIWLNADNDSTNNWIPIGGSATATSESASSGNSFKGTFDGGGHSIYNLYCNKSNYFHAGFFGKVSAATIHHIALINPTIISQGMMGSLVGFCYSGGAININNCIVINTSITGTGGNNIGGIIGANYSNTSGTSIVSCGVTGSLSGNYIGGMGGNSQYLTCTNCYFAGTLSPDNTNFGGLCAYSGTVNNCYSNITATSSTGNNGTVKTDAEMQAESFINDLDTTFRTDCYLNNGFPIKTWQSCGANITGTFDICTGESTTLTSNGFVSYLWSTGSTSSSITVSPTSTTSYYITVTNNSAEIIYDTVTVIVYPQAVITATAMPANDGIVHGTVSPTESYVGCGSSSTVSLTITPDQDWHISQILVNGVVVREEDPSDGSVVTFVVNPLGTLCDVEVYFSNLYTITTTLFNTLGEAIVNSSLVSPYGTNGVNVVTAGQDITYTFNETSRYHINDVSIDGASIGTSASYTFNNLQMSHTIVVTYDDNCGILTLPAYENFDLGTSGTTPECWTSLNTYSTSSIYPRLSSSYSSSSPNGLSFASGLGNYSLGVGPYIDNTIDISTMQVSFNTYYTSTNNGILEVGVMSNPNDATTFMPTDTFFNEGSGVWREKTAYFSNFTGTGNYIAFKWSNGSTSTTSGSNVYIDNVVFDLAPDCSPVINLQYSDLNGSNVTLNWEPNEVGTLSNYSIGIHNLTTDSWEYESTTDTNYVVMGLSEMSSYTITVSVLCSGGQSSNEQSVSFMTPCANPVGATVGSGTASTDGAYFPTQTYYNYSYSQQIFKASDLESTPQDFVGIAFQYYYSSNITRNLDIYLTHITDSAFTTGGTWFPVTNADKVFSGSVAFNNSSSWFNISFDTIFSYNGIDNLLLVVDDNTGSYLSSADKFYTHPSFSNCSQYVYNDYTNYDPLNPPTTGTCRSNRNNVQFIYCGTSNCIRPNTLAISNVTTNSVDISWISVGSESSWDIDYRIVGTTDWATETVSINPYTLTNLLANTSYEIRIRANCSNGEVSPWSDIIAPFRTNCGDVTTLPFTENFSASHVPNETNAIPYCWTKLTTDPSHYVYNNTSSSYAHSGSSYLDFHYTPNCYDIAILPTFSASIPLNTLAVTCWIRSGNINTGVFEIGIMEDITDSTSFVSIDTLLPSANNTYEEFIVSLTGYTGFGQNIAFKYSNGVGSSYLLDDVTVNIAPECITPNNLSVISSSFNAAELSWNERGDSQSWIIEYDTTGFTPGTGLTVTANTNPFTLTNLNPAYTYDAYVKAACINGGESNFSDPVTFSTGVCDTIDQCSYYFTLTATNTYAWNIYGSIKIYSNNILVNTLTLPSGVTSQTFEIPLCSNSQIEVVTSTSYDYYGTYCGFSIVDPFGENTIYSTSSLNGVSTCCTFTVNCTPPYCPRPTDIMVNNITTTSADISWTDPGQNSVEWIVEYDTAGFTPGTGTIFTTSSTSCSFTNLLPGSHYDFFIITNCVSDSSIATPMQHFFTSCDDYTTLPFTENFDGIVANNSAHTYLDCWSRFTSIVDRDPYVGNWGNSYYHSSPNCLDFNNSRDGFNMAILPPFDETIPINTLTVNFWAQADNATVGYMIVGVMTNPADTSSFVAVDTLSPLTNSTWYEYEVAMNSYQGTGKYITFKFDHGGNYAWRLDDIFIDLTPSCISPINLNVTTTTTTSIELAWTERGTATQWNIIYGPTGFDPETGGTTITVSTNPYTITGLSASTRYDFYVQSNCGPTDLSYLSEVLSSTTLCDVVTIYPYTEGFENGGVMPSCWTQNQVTGTASWTANSGAYSGSITSAHSGSYNALFFNSTDVVTLLISPLFDLSSVTNPTLSYWHAQQAWVADQDMLTVYYRSTPSAEWTMLNTYTSNISAWTFDSIALPNPSATYQIAFEGSATYGYGVIVDDITIYDGSPLVQQCDPPTNLSVLNITQTTADLTWTAGGNETSWMVEYKESSATDFTAQIANTTSYQLNGLLPNVNYSVRVKAVCSSDNESIYSTVVEFTTLPQVGNTYTIQATSGLYGTIFPIGDVVVNEGATQTFTITPDPEAEIAALIVDGSSTTIANTYTFSNVVANHTIHVDFTTGIEDFDLHHNIHIYPNPAYSFFTLSINDEKITEAKIFDVYGKLLKVIPINHNETTIDIQSFASGVYFINLLSENGIITKKLVKR